MDKIKGSRNSQDATGNLELNMTKLEYNKKKQIIKFAPLHINYDFSLLAILAINLVRLNQICMLLY